MFAPFIRCLILSLSMLASMNANAQNIRLNANVLVPPSNIGSEAPILLAQELDPATRVMQLEEQIRQLTGRIEDLGFQMLQMQEQLRQMQQDNEFRFQDLEDRAVGDQSSLSPKTNRPATSDALVGISNGDPTLQVETADTDAGEVYKSGYAHVLAGEYALATSVFQDYISLYPNGPEVADAHYWLGESLYAQGAFKDAARIFLDAHKTYPQATKAPDTLLKLGMSLMALDNRETACVTYDEVLARYPSASNAIKDRVASEKSRAQC